MKQPEGLWAFRLYRELIRKSAGGQLDIGHGDSAVTNTDRLVFQHGYPELVGFFRLIITKDRYGEIDSILNYFLDEVKKLQGIGVVYVTTAESLDPLQKQKVEKRILQTTGYKRLEMHYKTDKELIGGMVIRIGDRVVDSSVKTKLNELTKQLLKVQLVQ